MTLTSVGNPDLAQYTPVSDPEEIEANRLDELVDGASAYISRWNLGAGNWSIPVVFENGGPHGRLAYNMRIIDLET